MLPIETFRTTLGKIIAILQAFQIRFHLTGGITSIAYSEPRLTQDIDIVIENAAVTRQLDAFIRSLFESDFLFDETELRGGRNVLSVNSI
jgi:hypothetical protein